MEIGRELRHLYEKYQLSMFVVSVCEPLVYMILVTCDPCPCRASKYSISIWIIDAIVIIIMWLKHYIIYIYASGFALKIKLHE